MVEPAEKNVELYRKKTYVKRFSLQMKIDGTFLSNFVIRFFYIYLFIFSVMTLYFVWNFYNRKNNKVINKINSRVAEEMAKKITEDATMYRKSRQEED